jgi:hypothetical protein
MKMSRTACEFHSNDTYSSGRRWRVGGVGGWVGGGEKDRGQRQRQGTETESTVKYLLDMQSSSTPLLIFIPEGHPRVMNH